MSGKLFIKIMNKPRTRYKQKQNLKQEEIALSDFFLILLSMLFNIILQIDSN
jgi:hypothetical protein